MQNKNKLKKTAVISGMERSRHLNYFYQKKKEKEVNIYWHHLLYNNSVYAKTSILVLVSTEFDLPIF